MEPPDAVTLERAITERMKLLHRFGFQQSVIYDELAGVDAIMFTRSWRGMRDTVLAYSDDEAAGYRVPDVDFDPADPFTVEPDRKLWSLGGSFLEVTGELLSLAPPPGHAHFPNIRMPSR